MMRILSKLRLLSITLLLVSSVVGADTSEKIEEFLSDKYEGNSRISSIDIKVVDEVPLKQLQGWSGYIVEIKAYLKDLPKKPIKQKTVWYSNGVMITKELVNMDTGEDMSRYVKPKFQPKYYTKSNLIYGSENARHKVVIFSDPLCPFCRGYVPGALKEMKKDPKKFAVYYYHFPLDRLHPASPYIVKMATAAEMEGVKDVMLKIYNIKINPRETDEKKILKAFNKAVGTHLTLEQINTKAVIDHVNHDLEVANELMVGGTPTVYLDGHIDKSKKGYKKVK